MSTEKYMFKSIEDNLIKLTDGHPFYWIDNLISELDELLIEEGYDRDEIFNIAFPLLKIILSRLVDASAYTLLKSYDILEKRAKEMEKNN